MYYVYSTLTSNMKYTIYRKNSPDLPIVERAVLIQGGANLADKKNPLVTPKGFVTQITDEDYAALERNEIFQLHVKNGYVKIEKSERKVEKAISDLKERDESAPKVRADFPEDQSILIGTEMPGDVSEKRSKKR